MPTSSLEALLDSSVSVLIAAGVWLIGCAIDAVLSGWVLLAAQYRHRGERPPGVALGGHVLGGILERSWWRSSNVIATESGLYLDPGWLGRFLHPPLLIPWTTTHVAREIHRFWTAHGYELDLGSGVIQITEGGYEALQPYLVHTSYRRHRRVKADGRQDWARSSADMARLIEDGAPQPDTLEPPPP